MHVGGHLREEPSELQEGQRERGNIISLGAVSVVLGFSIGIYETALPFYLHDAKFSRPAMGAIYALPALMTFVLRLGAGSWSDFVGRKTVYTLSLLLTGLTSFLTPIASTVVGQTVLKSIREPALEVRRMLHSVLIYEGMPRRFLDLFGKTQGAEYVFQCFGALAAAGAYAWWAPEEGSLESPLLFLSGGVLAVGALWFASGYREMGFVRSPRVRLDLMDILRPNLDKKLYVLMASIFVFNVGLSCSHCFALQLFFLEKFAVSKKAIFIIMAAHRLSMAIPLLFVGRVVRGELRRLMMLFMVTEGLLIGVPGVLPTFGWAVGVWLLHDFFGAGIWLPIQHALLQRYSRAESRGKEVSLVLSVSYLGMVLGPALAGALSEMKSVPHSWAVSLPFIVGGGFVAASAIFLVFLRERSENSAK